MKTIIVNFYGGPCTGKSKMGLRLTSDLKDLGYKVDYTGEYAKDMTWQKSHHILSNQHYIFAKQQNRIWRLYNQVEFIVTDSSLLNSVVYCKDETSELFKKYVHEEYNSRNNLNINLLRGKYYDPKGRNQTLDEAIQLDKEITEVVESKYGFDLIIPGELEYSEKVLTFVVDKYKQLIQS